MRGDRRTAVDLARFEREVRLTARLTHPNTIAIYDYGRTPEGDFYYAMEFLDGASLQTLVDETGPMGPARVIHILRQVLASLTEAHDAGLVHRDIKPANIVLCVRGGEHDVVKVLDFGLVKPLDPEQFDDVDVDLSAAGKFSGTPQYIAPEGVYSPEEVGARSDLYSVGAVGFFLLTGTPVFQGDMMAVFARLLREDPPSPSLRLGAAIPSDLERVLLKALSRQPADRPESARAFAVALDACEDARGWRPEDAARWWREHGDDVPQETAVTSTSPPRASPEALDDRRGSARARVERHPARPRLGLVMRPVTHPGSRRPCPRREV